MMPVKALSLVLLALFLSETTGWAVPLEQEYKLKEICADQAEKVFNDGYALKVENSTQTVISSFTSHFSRKLNRCFMVVKQATVWKNKGYPPPVNEMSELIDVNESREYGRLTVSFKYGPDGVRRDIFEIQCYINFGRKTKETCKSESEWEYFIEPYMKE